MNCRHFFIAAAALFTFHSSLFTLPAAGQTYNNVAGLVGDCADPFVLQHEGKYYLYGTGGRRGIKVYVSDNLVSWSPAAGARDGFALDKEDVWGESGFWAPEVYLIDGRFKMYFTVEERIAVAESVSPLGPFVQAPGERAPFHADIPEIDTHVFTDDDGRRYLYFVRFTGGNEIWVAELGEDGRSIREETLTRCFGTSQPWEDSAREPYPHARVNEGPFVLKHNGLYYLTYSANHTANPDYGVGYAVGESPFGPWTKHEANPILTGNGRNINGPGHHSFTRAPSGQLYCVYHTHFDMTRMAPRKTAIDPAGFEPSPDGGPDILRIHGPSDEDRQVERGLHYWRNEQGYLQDQEAEVFSLARQVLAANPPTTTPGPERRLALAALDAALHDLRTGESDQFRAWIEGLTLGVAEELETSKADVAGTRIFRLYNDGFIVRTGSVTIAVDIIPGGGEESPFVSPETMRRIVDQCDVLFITHGHGDHIDLSVARMFLDAGKEVVAPEELWKTEVLPGPIRVLRGAEGELANAEIPAGGARLTVRAWPGFQDTTPNNVYAITTPEGVTVMHTGDFSYSPDAARTFAGAGVKVDALMVQSWMMPMAEFVAGIDPRVVVPGHENEMGHSIDHREAWWLTGRRMAGVEPPVIITAWGEWFDL